MQNTSTFNIRLLLSELNSLLFRAFVSGSRTWSWKVPVHSVLRFRQRVLFPEGCGICYLGSLLLIHCPRIPSWGEMWDNLWCPTFPLANHMHTIVESLWHIIPQLPVEEGRVLGVACVGDGHTCGFPLGVFVWGAITWSFFFVKEPLAKHGSSCSQSITMTSAQPFCFPWPTAGSFPSEQLALPPSQNAPGELNAYLCLVLAVQNEKCWHGSRVRRHVHFGYHTSYHGVGLCEGNNVGIHWA